jgi:hypothetical protein
MTHTYKKSREAQQKKKALNVVDKELDRPKGERRTNQRAQSDKSRHCINKTWEDNIIKGRVKFKWKGDRCIEADKKGG